MDHAFLLECCKAAIREIRLSPKSLTAIPVPLDDRSIGRFLGLVQAGNRPADASWAVGLAWGEIRRYLELGHQGIEPYRALYDRFKQAEALAAIQDNQYLTSAMKDGKVDAIKFRMQARHGWSTDKAKKPSKHVHLHGMDPAMAGIPTAPRVVDNLDDLDQNSKQAVFFEMIRERQEEKTLLRKLRAGEIDPKDVIDNLPQVR